MPILTIFQKTEEDKTFPNSSHEARITLTPKPTTRHHKKKKNTNQYPQMQKSSTKY